MVTTRSLVFLVIELQSLVLDGALEALGITVLTE